MAEIKRPQSKGLKWRKRAGRPDVAYWFASPEAVQEGYSVKSVNLSRSQHDERLLLDRAERLQREMVAWLAGRKKSETRFDGTFETLLKVYQTDPESDFRTVLKPGTVKVYTTYLKKLIDHIGHLRVDEVDGRDVKRWFAQWRIPQDGPSRDQIPAARMMLAVLKAAISFGIICRFTGCPEFKAILAELEFDMVPSRTFAPTADQIIAARKAAHAAGEPRRALAYAIQFETTLRQWDVIGQWVDLSDPKPSAIIRGRKKWIGPMWSAIDKNLILAKVRPTKTEDTTEVEVSFDLSVCPMVTEELALIPEDKRVGPLIIKEANGLPYFYEDFRLSWRKDATAAGLPKTLWNRDLRAGGITEGGKAGAAKDDRRKLAGHAREETTEIYDRDTVEAHRRVMQSRKAFRERKNEA